MKKLLCIIRAGCSMLVFVVCGCSEQVVKDAGLSATPAAFSVDQARSYFERVATPTRAGAEDGAFTLGAYTVDWSRAAISSGEERCSFDVPVQGEFRYYRYRLDGEGQPRFSPIYHKLVVVKDLGTDEMGSYLRFYIPSPDYAAGRREEDYDRFLNNSRKGDFSGLAVYTSLDGFPVCAVRYVEGVWREEAFLGDESRPKAESTAHLRRMLDGLNVVWSVEGAKTRAKVQSENDYWGEFDIDAVEIWGKHENHFAFMGDGRSTTSPSGDESGSTNGGGGGGGGGGLNPFSPPSEKYRENENIKIASDSKEKVESILDSLRKDCMAGKIIGSIQENVIIRTGFFGGSVMRPTAYIFEDGVIWGDYAIKMGSRLDDITLLEELFHTRQCSGKTFEEYGGMRLNNEIEAKLCWYMYRKKIGNMKNVSSYMIEGDGDVVFRQLRTCVLSGDTQSDTFRNAYRSAASVMRQMSRSYADPARYPFSEDAIKVDALMKMIADCPEYKNK